MKDNSKIAEAIRSVLIEYGVPKLGTAYEDNALNAMYETYNKSNSKYYVVSKGDAILGGAGIAQLEHYNGPVCELQKMYFTKEARGKGLGSKMMHICLKFATSVGYEACYLETMPYMEDARKLYRKTGFVPLEKPMGDTGHYSCQLWMIKSL